MRATVDILMATYNGAQFLEEQIQSLLDQTFTDWNLLIHDDRSQDETISIIKAYQQQDNRIKLLEDGTVFRSSSANFMHLLHYSTASLVIFCDQDDIWFTNKLEVLVAAIKSKNGPCAVYCNAYLMFGRKVTSVKAVRFERNNLQDSLFLNGGVLGNSLLFNKELIRLLGTPPDFIAMHDHFITIAALTFGRLFYIDVPLMYYRQHENNVTGNMDRGYIQRTVNFFKGQKYVVDRAHYEALRSFHQCYGDLIPPVKLALFQAYFSYVNSDSVLKRLKIINRFNFQIGSNRMILLFKTILRKPVGPNL